MEDFFGRDDVALKSEGLQSVAHTCERKRGQDIRKRTPIGSTPTLHQGNTI